MSVADHNLNRLLDTLIRSVMDNCITKYGTAASASYGSGYA